MTQKYLFWASTSTTQLPLVDQQALASGAAMRPHLAKAGKLKAQVKKDAVQRELEKDEAAARRGANCAEGFAPAPVRSRSGATPRDHLLRGLRSQAKEQNSRIHLWEKFVMAAPRFPSGERSPSCRPVLPLGASKALGYLMPGTLIVRDETMGVSTTEVVVET